MEEVKLPGPRPVFKNQPILCPWVTCQPYPSAQVIKNKLKEIVKNRCLALNDNASKTDVPQPAVAHIQYSAQGQQPSSTHFFYFLRLMQLFPDTHPATLHTVLTLSKNNFFYTIDKLLYAKKCKGSFNKRQQYPFKPTRGRGGFSGRGRGIGNRNQPFQQLQRNISDDLAEVQRIIGLAEKPYAESNASTSDNDIVNICVENPEQIVSGSQTFVNPENQEVIEIVCFENEQDMEHPVVHQEQVMEHHPVLDQTPNFEDCIDLVSGFEEDRIKSEVLNMDEEPAVIVVENGHLIDLESADLANRPIAEERYENSIDNEN